MASSWPKSISGTKIPKILDSSTPKENQNLLSVGVLTLSNLSDLSDRNPMSNSNDISKICSNRCHTHSHWAEFFILLNLSITYGTILIQCFQNLSDTLPKEKDLYMVDGAYWQSRSPKPSWIPDKADEAMCQTHFSFHELLHFLKNWGKEFLEAHFPSCVKKTLFLPTQIFIPPCVKK